MTDSSPTEEPALGVNAAPDVRSYLRRSGWIPTTRGDAGEMWTHESAEHPIAVPRRMRLGSAEWVSVAERLAAFERVNLSTVERALRGEYVDITRLQAGIETVVAGTIPLTAGSALVSSGVAMLRASATTAQRLRGHIGSGYSRIGDELASHARLAHTEEGSFIVPILVPLSRPPDRLPGAPQPEIEAFGPSRNPYEPAERRVTRTLATALSSLQQNIVQPAGEVTRRALHPFVEAGGSREMVLAVTRILDQDAVATLVARFEWSPSVDNPVKLPAVVTISAGAKELLVKAAELLRQERYVSAQILSGPIVEVRHEPDDPLGEIAIQTVFRGRPCEVRVTLTPEQVDQANLWMSGRRIILAEGEVQSGVGKPLRIAAPRRVLPLDETMLYQRSSQDGLGNKRDSASAQRRRGQR